MEIEVLLGFFAAALVSSVTLFYVALGEVAVERAGLINLGAEGVILVGAASSFAVGVSVPGPWGLVLGLLTGVTAGVLLQLALGWLTVLRRANQLASGLALLFLGQGLAGLIGRPFVGRNLAGLNPWVLVILMPLAAGALWFALFKTRWGLELRAAGEHPETAFAAGVNVKARRFQALGLGGALGGLGGAFLSLAVAQTWAPGMSAGRGFIAVALVIFAAWKPGRTLAGALLFGGALALQIQLQARGAPVSPFLLDMLPYLLTLAVLLLWRKAGKNAMPESLKSVFENS